MFTLQDSWIHENPSCQASCYMLVAEPQWSWTDQRPMRNYWQLQVWLRCDDSETVCSETTMAAPREVSIDAVIARVISELESPSSLRRGITSRGKWICEIA